MRRHPKAPSSGSSTRPGRWHGKVAAALIAAVCVSLLVGLALASATSPTVSVEATEVGFTSARGVGEINPGEKETSYHFEYIDNPTFEASGWAEAAQVGFGTLPEGINSATAVEPAGLTGLASDTEYHLRLLAQNDDGSEEATTTFTTQVATAPGLVLDPASKIAFTKTRISGDVEPGGGNVNPVDGAVPIHWELQYTPASEPAGWQVGGSGTLEGEDAESTSAVEVAADLTGLKSATEYLYRLHVTFAGEEATTPSASFTTASSVGPAATTEEADYLGPQNASLFGSVNPNEEETHFWFEFGPTASYGTSVPVGEDALLTKFGEPDTGDQERQVIRYVGGLEPATTYHFRLVAENPSGTAMGADRTFTTLPAPTGPGQCPNAGKPGVGFLPDCRGWEMVSPPGKGGGSVGALDQRTHAAADGSAVTFISVVPFGDVQGTSIETEYMAERDPVAGASGWSTHAITPLQEPRNFSTISGGFGAQYLPELSPDLSTGIVRTWSPLTDDPAVAVVDNLYLRRDLRDPGPGSYTLLTSCVVCGGSPLTWKQRKSELPWLAGTSDDFDRVLFESRFNLTGAGSGKVRLYASENGSVHLVGVVPPAAATECTGSECELPPGGGSSAGLGASQPGYTPGVISRDGSRVNFSAPTTSEGTIINSGLGPKTNVYQSDSQGTAATDDDTVRQLNVSERESPGETGAGVYQAASEDGSRVFFTSSALLTDDAQASSRHLYMWHDYLNDEVQKLTVAATGGQFRLVLSGEETGDLAFDATPAQVAAALEALPPVSSAGGQITVTGGPGNAAGASPYTIRFAGGLAETDLPKMTVDPGTVPLSGDAADATVNPWVKGGGHLSVIDHDAEPGTAAHPDPPDDALGVIGASADGSRVYFSAGGQLVHGAPIPGLEEAPIYLWDEGTISYIGSFASRADAWRNMASFQGQGLAFTLFRLPSRIAPDGGSMLFGARNGFGLTGNAQGLTGCSSLKDQPCWQFYVYDARTESVACATCPPAGSSGDFDAEVEARNDEGGLTPGSTHLNHALSSDGRFVFFTTAEPLVEEDTNGVKDAYEYDTVNQQAHLLSSGTSPFDSYFLDAGSDGSDVFFVTRERLAGWDVDDAYDLYDARIEGGMPEPPLVSAPCEGEGCRAAAAPGGHAPPVGSATHRGPGSPTPRHCPPGKRPRLVKGKSRCIKKYSKKHHKQKRSNHNRRAGR